MDIQRDDEGGAEITFDVRTDITTKFHEKFVAIQALGAQCLGDQAYESGEKAAFLALRIGDTKHEDENGDRLPVTVSMDEFELDTFTSALKQLQKDKAYSLRVAANSGDMMNCAYRTVEVVVAKEMSEKLKANRSNVFDTRGAEPKRVGFGRD